MAGLARELSGDGLRKCIALLLVIATLSLPLSRIQATLVPIGTSTYSSFTPNTPNPEIDPSKISVYCSSGKMVNFSLPFSRVAVSYLSVDGKTTIFVNDLRGGDKLEISLRNYTLLCERGYLEDGRVRIVILPGYPIQEDAYLVAYDLSETVFRVAQAKVYRVIPSLNGTVVKTYDKLPFIVVQIPYKNVFDLVSEEFIAHVFLDKRNYACLNESVPLIKPPEEWSSLESYFGYAIDGENVKITILDTGIDKTHPDLDDLDDDPDTYDPKVIAEKCFTNENRTEDGYGHGTHCASIAAGTGEASNHTYVGVAPGAYLLNGKVLTDGGWGYDSWIIDGIEWAVEQGTNIISMSFGADINGDGTDPLSMTIDWAVDQGVVCVVAAGNAGPGKFTVGIPAVARKAITVGATTKTDEMAWFTSWGPTADYRLKPDVVAPGVDIVAARAKGTSMGTPIDDYYTKASGTSMSTPHVAGVAALILQVHGNWNPTMVKSALMGKAVSISGASLLEQGAGRVSAPPSVNASLLIVEPSASFGILYGETANVTFTIMNLADRAISIDLSTSTTCDGVEVNYVHLNVSTLYISANSNRSVAMTVGPFDEEAPEGWYEGLLTVESIESRVKAPYLFAILSRINVRIYDVDNVTTLEGMIILTYPNTTYLDWSEATPKESAIFHLTSGEYCMFTQLAWIENGTLDSDFSRMFILEKKIVVPKMSNATIDFRLSDFNVSEIVTTGVAGESLTTHCYTQYFMGERHDTKMWWLMGSGWFGFDLNVSKLILYTSGYDPPDQLSEAFGFYASDEVLSSVYLLAWKYWNVSSIPSKVAYEAQSLARYSLYYNMPEAYPERGLNVMNTFWFTWEYFGYIQIWTWDTHRVFAGINATYHLAPHVAAYWGVYMVTYAGWESREQGPLEEWEVGSIWVYPPITPEEGEVGYIELGDFSFAPYSPGLHVNVAGAGDEYNVTLQGDVWKDLSWPHWQWWYWGGGPISPFPAYHPEYRVYVDGVLLDQGKLNGTKGVYSWWYDEWYQFVEGVDWNGINQTWRVPVGKVLIDLTLPSMAILCNNSAYSFSVTLGGSDAIPPRIESVVCPSSYSPGQAINVSFSLSDEGLGIDTVVFRYSFDDGETWSSDFVDYGEWKYGFLCVEADRLSIMINVTDKAGNSIQYVARTIAVGSKVEVDVPTIVNYTDPVTVAKVTTIQGDPIDGVALSLWVNDSLLYVPLMEGKAEASLQIGVYDISGVFPEVGLYAREVKEVALAVSGLSIDRLLVSRSMVDTNGTVTISARLVYAHNGTPIPGGDVALSGYSVDQSLTKEVHLTVRTDNQGWAVFNLTESEPIRYNFTIVGVNDNRYGITYQHRTQRVEVLWTHVVVDEARSSNSRVDVGSEQWIGFHCVWAHNDSPVVGGILYIEKKARATNATGWVKLDVTSQSVGLQLWTLTSVDCFGITTFVQTVANPSIIWDRVKVTQSGVVDERINVGDVGTAWFKAVYEYDNSSFDGVLYVNGTAARYLAAKGRWEANFSYNHVTKKSFVVDGVVDDVYGLTAYLCPFAPSIIWDKVIVSLSVIDERIDVGTNVRYAFSATYAYDGSTFSGSVTLNDTLAKDAVGKYGYEVSSISDALYGLTVFDTDAFEVIFDRIEVVDYGISDDRCDVGTTQTIWVKVRYDYDDEEFDSTNGDLSIGDMPAAWDSINNRWYVSPSRDSVGKNDYLTPSSVNDATHGLTVIADQAIVSVIWDEVEVTLRIVDERLGIGSTVDWEFTAIYAYDGSDASPHVSVTLNDTLVKDTVGKYGYKASSIIDERYGLTKFTTNEVYAIFDRILIDYQLETLTPGITKVVVSPRFEYDGLPVRGASVIVNGIAAEEVVDGVYEVSFSTWSFTPELSINVGKGRLEPVEMRTVGYSMGNIILAIAVSSVVVAFVIMKIKRGVHYIFM